MKKKINFPLIIVSIFIILYFYKSCNPDTVKTEIIIETDTIIVKDTIIDTIQTEPTLITEYIYIPKNIDIDTPNIIRRYFSKKLYSDTIKDENFLIVINDTLYQNEVFSREVYKELYKDTVFIYEKVKMVNTDSIPADNYLSAGIVLTTEKNLYGNLYYTKNNNTYGIGYNPLNRSFQFTYIRILRWKK